MLGHYDCLIDSHRSKQGFCQSLSRLWLMHLWDFASGVHFAPVLPVRVALCSGLVQLHCAMALSL
jgi:hypothetical protein